MSWAFISFPFFFCVYRIAIRELHAHCVPAVLPNLGSPWWKFPCAIVLIVVYECLWRESEFKVVFFHLCFVFVFFDLQNSPFLKCLLFDILYLFSWYFISFFSFISCIFLLFFSYSVYFIFSFVFIFSYFCFLFLHLFLIVHFMLCLFHLSNSVVRKSLDVYFIVFWSIVCQRDEAFPEASDPSCISF